MKSCSFEYIAAGGNLHHSAADWDRKSGILAYGANNNLALWNPLVRHGQNSLVGAPMLTRDRGLMAGVCLISYLAMLKM